MIYNFRVFIEGISFERFVINRYRVEYNVFKNARVSCYFCRLKLNKAEFIFWSKDI